MTDMPCSCCAGQPCECPQGGHCCPCNKSGAGPAVLSAAAATQDSKAAVSGHYEGGGR